MMINMQENTSCDPPIDSWRAQPYRHPPDMAWGTLPANGTLSLARAADTEKKPRAKSYAKNTTTYKNARARIEPAN